MKKIIIYLIIGIFLILTNNCDFGTKTSKFFNLTIIIDGPQSINSDKFPDEIRELNLVYDNASSMCEKIKSVVPLVKIVRIDTLCNITTLTEDELSTKMVFGLVKTGPKQGDALAEIIKKYYESTPVEKGLILPKITKEYIELLNRIKRYVNSESGIFIYKPNYKLKSINLFEREQIVYNNIELLKQNLAKKVINDLCSNEMKKNNYVVLFNPEWLFEEEFLSINPDFLSFGSPNRGTPLIEIKNPSKKQQKIKFDLPEDIKKLITIVTPSDNSVIKENTLTIDPNETVNLKFVLTGKAEKDQSLISIRKLDDNSTIKEISIYFTSQSGPAIIEHPKDLRVRAGENAIFKVVAFGKEPLLYQWRFNGNDIIGETKSTFMIEDATNRNVGKYSVRVWNETGEQVSHFARLNISDSPRKDTIRFTNGDIYIGEIKNSTMHGDGQYIYSGRERISKFDRSETYSENGDKLIGRWNEGRFDYGTLIRNRTGERIIIIIGKVN